MTPEQHAAEIRKLEPAMAAAYLAVDVLQVTYAVSYNAKAGSLLPVIPSIEALLSAFLVRRCYNSLAIYTV